MKLQYTKKRYHLTIPAYCIKWLLWEQGDKIDVYLDQLDYSIKLSCHSKVQLKEMQRKKEIEQNNLIRIRETTEQIRAYEDKVIELKKKLEAERLTKKAERMEIEVDDLQHEIDFERDIKCSDG